MVGVWELKKDEEEGEMECVVGYEVKGRRVEMLKGGKGERGHKTA